MNEQTPNQDKVIADVLAASKGEMIDDAEAKLTPFQVFSQVRRLLYQGFRRKATVRNKKRLRRAALASPLLQREEPHAPKPTDELIVSADKRTYRVWDDGSRRREVVK